MTNYVWESIGTGTRLFNVIIHMATVHPVSMEMVIALSQSFHWATLMQHKILIIVLMIRLHVSSTETIKILEDIKIL